MTTETKQKPWKFGDDINPESVNKDSLDEIIEALEHVLKHIEHPREFSLSAAEIQQTIDLAKGLAEDLGKLSSNIDDVTNYIDEHDGQGSIDALATLQEALTDNLPPWVWSEALEAAEKGDTIRVRKVFELS